MSTHPDESAFPELHIYHWKGVDKENGVSDNVLPRWNGGLSKREWFAGMAMEGYVAGMTTHGTANDCWINAYNAFASLAVRQADALIAELNKEPQA